MATSMSSAFTAPERRKKVITYGKASRLAPIPPPTASIEAPSLERPRKHTATSIEPLKKVGGGLKSVGTNRTTAATPDIFDVPSDDDSATHPIKPTRKLPTKHQTQEEDVGSRSQNGRVLGLGRLRGTTTDTTRKGGAAKMVAPVAVKTQKSVQLPKIASVPTFSEKGLPRTARRGNIPQPAQDVRASDENKPKGERPTTNAKTIPRAPSPELSALKATKSTKTNAILPARSATTKHVAKSVNDANIFDVPSSDDEANLPTPKPVRRALIVPRKEPVKLARPTPTERAQPATESDDSETARKRKRRGSVSSTVVTSKVAVKQKQDDSLPQRSRKYQKKEDSISPGHEHDQHVPTIASTVPAHKAVPAVHKPKRTRLRTVPVITRPSVAKGQSSPASLHSMLPRSRVKKSSPTAEASEVTTLEDETMYEIPDSTTTPIRPSSNTASGSVTPRQKALFGSLLGTSTTHITPMPSISKLQITDRKPASLLGALSRSKSDLTPSTQSRKTKLIASLKPALSSSDSEASGSDSGTGSDEEMEEPTPKATTSRRMNGHPSGLRQAIKVDSDDMDVQDETTADSQTSQGTSGFGIRPKFTYAKSRSYLQEANPEDEFLMSMDLGDPVASGSQNKDSQTEDEDEASQVRPNHELKRTGQNTKFQWDNQMLIDDITIKSAPGIRRSTMLELVTKLANETFAHDLRESSLADQFFESITSNGEIIFDFAVAVAAIFMLRSKPTYTSLDQAYRSGVISTLVTLLDNDSDIVKIAKNRKTNLSNIAKESVAAFRSTVLESAAWPMSTLDKLSPQLVAMKALDLLVVGLRNTGNVESIISQDAVGKLVEIGSSTSEHCKANGASPEAKLALSTIFSTLEAVSLAKQKQMTWSSRMLQRLAGTMAMSFENGDAQTTTLAVKLCMNLTNNKPKACQQFSDPALVQSLVQSIIDRTQLLGASLEDVQRTEALDALILSLGAMINLTEHSDQARVNIDDGERLIETLVKTFVEGSIQTAQVSFTHSLDRDHPAYTEQAVSMEESQSSVAVGYLSVLLGNMCLNTAMKRRIRTHLPDQELTTLVEKIKEFVSVHEHANRKAKQFEGAEGQETWQNYTARIMLVVKQLEE